MAAKTVSTVTMFPSKTKAKEKARGKKTLANSHALILLSMAPAVGVTNENVLTMLGVLGPPVKPAIMKKKALKKKSCSKQPLQLRQKPKPMAKRHQQAVAYLR